ncbi:hypothetical protein EVAR_10151_1 [Eumeta japonica]|uniref:Uncharacterized protein n=1 Tax=Eumeta variegata TaxID=151549 RepID=A0A4C1UD46_EUMVA|nr:hypothetical protein EVAR_10151_1 [Eumeta japonica]
MIRFSARQPGAPPPSMKYPFSYIDGVVAKLSYHSNSIQVASYYQHPAKPFVLTWAARVTPPMVEEPIRSHDAGLSQDAGGAQSTKYFVQISTGSCQLTTVQPFCRLIHIPPRQISTTAFNDVKQFAEQNRA